jgi:hypothetical protein
VPLWPFRPQCPVDADTQAWVHTRFKWLADQFGMSTCRLGRAIEPTDEFFPEPLQPTDQSVRKMLDRVCGYMKVPPARFQLLVLNDGPTPPVAVLSSLQSRPPRSVTEQIAEGKSLTLEDPMLVVATFAHELARVRLLGEHRVAPDADDLDDLVDLATVFFGMGIFSANSVFAYSQWSREGWTGWKASRSGYLDEETCGYALALWTTLRAEPRPRWSRHLKVNPLTYMKQAIAYLKQYPPAEFPT